MGSRSGQQAVTSRYRLIVIALLGLILALAGGASRYDEDQQVVVRLAAIAAFAASLWPLEFRTLRAHWRLIAAVAAAYLLLLLQLAPLPPAVWAQLPGHAIYAKIAQEAGSVSWRPLSLTPDLTLEALYALLPATAAGLCALYLDASARLRIAQGIVAVACLSAALGLVQLASSGGLHLFRETSADAPIGLFANRNHQAGLMALALPLIGALSGLRVRDGRDLRITLAVALSAAVLLLSVLILTGSRMGLLLGAIGAAGAVWSWRASGHRILPARWPMRLAMAGVAAPMLAGIAFAASHGTAAGRLAKDGITGDTRAAMFAPLLSTARAFMPVGAGFGSFDSVYRRFEPNALLSTIYMNQAHDEPMQYAIEGGAPALALLLLFFVWWAVTAVQSQRPSNVPRRRSMGAAAITVTAILMASSLVDYPLRTPLLGAIFAVACVEVLRAADGLGSAAWRRDASRRQARP